MTRSSKAFRAGTRDSKLSLIQTRGALARLGELLPGARFEDAPTSSPGDRDRRTDLRESPPDFFTRDLDEALLACELDCAVHSAKDLPDPVPEGLDWFRLPWAEDARDALVLPPGRAVGDLPVGARIGVSSDRRAAYCRRRFPEARPCPIRGNVEERLARLDRGEYDAVITAAAALIRLDVQDRITELIPLADLPTPDGQGALAVTFRAGDERFLCLRGLFVKAVTFVGAGAGTAEACTLAGARALGRCDVCLHDALVDRALLERLPAGARTVDVGKRSGRRSAEQADITRLIADETRKGRRVVRLKGGDPGVFGRLAEETEALDSLRLPYRVIPGVSSLNAATTGTGMLLTRRGGSRGFCAMTGRGRGGAVARVGSAERAKLPVVFFMGLGVADALAEQLVGDGMPEDTPAAFVFGAGSDEQVVVRGELGDIAERARGAGSDAPALLIVGEAARCAFPADRGALAGRRVLLTCSEALQDRAADAVTDLGGVPLRRPLIRLRPEPAALERLRRIAEYDWVVLTSPSAVRVLLGMLGEAGADLRALPRIMASGPGTARELRKAVLRPDVEPGADFGAGGIAELAASVIEPGARILRFRSDAAGPSLAESLSARGAAVEDCVLYRNEPVAYDRLPAFDAAFFASGSAVRAFASQWGADALAGRTVLVIGEPTAAALRREGLKPDVVSPEATVEASIFALAVACVRESLEGMP